MCRANLAADAASEISGVTPEMLKAEAAHLDDPSAGLDDSELDMNKLVIDDVETTQTAKRYAVIVFMTQSTQIFTLL